MKHEPSPNANSGLRVHPLDLDVPPDEPFRNDALNRRRDIELLTRLIEHLSESPFVMALDAPWGMGKTTFVRIWQAHLENKGYPTCYFNAWESDFTADPFIALLSHIREFIDTHESSISDKEEVEKQFEKLKKAGAAIAKSGSLKKVGAAIAKSGSGALLNRVTAGIIDVEKIEKELQAPASAEELLDAEIHAFRQERESRSLFRLALSRLALCLTKKGEASPRPLVLFLDEVDRCRPDYALLLLERVKHIFSVKGVIVVVSLAIDQLVETAKSVYGPGMSAEGYVKRFFDWRYRIYVQEFRYLCKGFQERCNISAKHFPVDEHLLCVYIEEMAALLRVSARDIERCYTTIVLALLSEGASNGVMTMLIAILGVLKEANRQVFERFIDESIDALDVFMEVMSDQVQGRPVLWSDFQLEALRLIIELGMPVGEERRDEFKRVVGSLRVKNSSGSEVVKSILGTLDQALKGNRDRIQRIASLLGQGQGQI
jgi:hypothetical protein